MKTSSTTRFTKLIIYLLLVLLILLLLNYLPKIFTKDIATVLPIDFEYKETLSTEGILIKNEKLYFSQTKGEIYGIVDEGVRVPVGIEIAHVISPKDMTNYKSELDSIESLINQITFNNEGTGTELSSKEHIADNIVSQIQTDIKNEEYKSLKNSKEELLFYLSNEVISKNIVNSEVLSKDQLVEKRKQLIKEISNHNERLFSRHSGILSYEIDNIEELLYPSDLEGACEYIYDSDLNPEFNVVSSDKPIFKIIDGHEYYIAIKISELEGQLLIDKEKLEIEIIDIDDTKINFIAPIIKSYFRGSEEVIILKSNQYLEKIYNYRFLNLDIVTFKKDSFKVPINSLTYNNDQIGLYVKSFYDVVVFRPIIINAKDEQFAYVSKGDANNKIEIGDNMYKTINEFSEIIINPNLVEEGQILN